MVESTLAKFSGGFEMVVQKQSDDRIFSIFLLAWAVVFGAVVRVFPVLRSEMPGNDGGLFFSLAQDIKAANFLLEIG